MKITIGQMREPYFDENKTVYDGCFYVSRRYNDEEKDYDEEDEAYHSMYLKEDGTWHEMMTGAFGTWFETLEDAKECVQKYCGDVEIFINCAITHEKANKG